MLIIVNVFEHKLHSTKSSSGLMFTSERHRNSANERVYRAHKGIPYFSMELNPVFLIVVFLNAVLILDKIVAQ